MSSAMIRTTLGAESPLSVAITSEDKITRTPMRIAPRAKTHGLRITIALRMNLPCGGVLDLLAQRLGLGMIGIGLEDAVERGLGGVALTEAELGLGQSDLEV